MRALVLDREVTFRSDFPAPTRVPGESIVDVVRAGICATDLELARGYMNYRGIPGHEFVGRVRASDQGSMIGRRVVGEINAGCGRCESCRAGLGRHCANRTVLGILGRNGAWAEQLALPDANLRLVPDNVPDELAVFVEPLAAAFEILEQVQIPRNAGLLVLGDGRLGALVALALQSEGYLPLVAGRHREKLARLQRLGLETITEGTLDHQFDLVVDCTGRNAGFERAVSLVRPRGTLVLKSTTAASAAINLAPLVVNEISVVGSRCGRFEPALDALAAGRIDPRPLIDATFALEDGAAAVRAAANPENFKVLLSVS